MTALLDTCILIDALQHREGFSEDAQGIFLMAARGEFGAYITAKSLLDVYYIMRKYLNNEKATREAVEKIMDLFTILNTTGEDCILALGSKTSDYEDAVMIETAKREKMECIITRNIKDYKDAGIKVVTPKQFLCIL